MKFPDGDRLAPIVENGQAAVRYVDSDGEPTEQYPLNPNGSAEGIAGLCSKDGRHLVGAGGGVQ